MQTQVRKDGEAFVCAVIGDVDKASFQALMKPVYEKFMTTADMKRLVKATQDTK